MSKEKVTSRNPWMWVPSLYYAEGVPYAVVMFISVIMYKKLGLSNTYVALYTSWLYLPWVIKPLWSPFVDLINKKRFWIILMQLIVGAGLAGLAFSIPTNHFLQYTLAFFWLIAFSSATHDIAADGFYMLGLSEHDQSFFVGIRSLFYRFAMLTGQGLLVILAGYFESTSGLPPVDINIYANPSINLSQKINPDTISISQINGELKIIPSEYHIEIATNKLNKYSVDSVTAFVKFWNIKHGFFQNETNTSSFRFKGKESEKNVFNGNIGILFVHLSKPPDTDKPIIVTLDRESGDKSISLVEGSRFVFTQKNWNISALSLIQLDSKLKTKTSALFSYKAGDIPFSWSSTLFILSALFLLFFIYHKFILPHPLADKSAAQGQPLTKEFFESFKMFFKKDKIGLTIAFLLIYRLGEAQLIKLASPFFLDQREVGGLGLTLGEVGLAYGTVGVLSLVFGGILGGFLASRDGLKKWLWWMFIAINVPALVYITLSYIQPSSLYFISAMVAIEQFCYGFGFTAYMLYMIYIASGEFKTSHYAIATGFMALSMMLPGMFSGWIQELLGYKHFFVWVLFTMIPGFFIVKSITIDPEFGKKAEKAKE